MSEAVVYRMFNKADELLYIGITASVSQRLTGHKTEKAWWAEIDRIQLAHFSSRDDAEAHEKDAIQAESPRYNRAPGRPGRRPVTPEEREARRAEEEARRWWTPDPGEIRCANCAHEPDRVLRGQEIKSAPCKRCGCRSLKRIVAPLLGAESGEQIKAAA